MKGSEVILLLSGGIDSTTLLAELTANKKLVHCLSFDYNQRHSDELIFAKQNAKKNGVVCHHVLNLDYAYMAEGNSLTDNKVLSSELPDDDGPNHTYVPGRNLLMLSHAAAYAESKGIIDIYFAANGDDGKRFPDCSQSFISALNKLWQSCPNTARIYLHAPYIFMSKADVIRRGLELGVDFDQTLSCYSPVVNSACGCCLSCVLRQEAMNKALIKNKQTMQNRT
jgi:7-cyano-7-deazaguanine synthase